MNRRTLQKKLIQISEALVISTRIRRLKAMVPEAKKFFLIGQTVRVFAVVAQIAAFALPFHMLSLPAFSSDFVGVLWVGLASGLLLFSAAIANLRARKTIARARVVFEIKLDSWVLSSRNRSVENSEEDKPIVLPRGRPLSRLVEKHYVARIALLTSSLLLAIVFLWRVEIGLTYILSILILLFPFLNVLQRSKMSSFSLSSAGRERASVTLDPDETASRWKSTPIFERLTLTQQSQFLVSTFTTAAFVGALVVIAIGINWSASAPTVDVITLILLTRALSEQIEKGLSEYASSLFFAKELDDFIVFLEKFAK